MNTAQRNSINSVIAEKTRVAEELRSLLKHAVDARFNATSLNAIISAISEIESEIQKQIDEMSEFGNLG